MVYVHFYLDVKMISVEYRKWNVVRPTTFPPHTTAPARNTVVNHGNTIKYVRFILLLYTRGLYNDWLSRPEFGSIVFFEK